MYYWNHKKIHVMCICTFFALVLTNAILLAVFSVDLTFGNDTPALIILAGAMLFCYILNMLFPNKLFPIFYKLGKKGLENTDTKTVAECEARRAYMRMRYVWLAIANFALMLSILSLFA